LKYPLTMTATLPGRWPAEQLNLAKGFDIGFPTHLRCVVGCFVVQDALVLGG